MSSLNGLQRQRLGRVGACSVACALLLAAGCTGVVFRATDATFEPGGPDGADNRQIVAFMAPYDPRGSSRRGAYAAAVNSLRQGLSHVTSCAELSPDAVRLILVERVTVVRGADSRAFELPEVAGIVLMDGEREPRLVDAGSAAVAIPAILAAHAAEYFSAPDCAD